VLNYSPEEEQYFPCHASPADLAAHSRFFEQVFMSPASAELINHRYITVDLDIPQEILHMIVEGLYLRRWGGRGRQAGRQGGRGRQGVGKIAADTGAICNQCCSTVGAW
jgi:hypothetical protein